MRNMVGQEYGRAVQHTHKSSTVSCHLHLAQIADYSCEVIHSLVRRCGECSACHQKEDCGRCDHCRDMKKFGGPFKKRQKCRQRQCLSLGRSSLKHKKVIHIAVDLHGPLRFVR